MEKKPLPLREENPKGLHLRYVIQKVVGVQAFVEVPNRAYGHSPYATATKREWQQVTAEELQELPQGTQLRPMLSDIDDNAEYFILRLDTGGSDPEHIKAGRIGIHAYATAIEHHLPDLARDLRERYPLL